MDDANIEKIQNTPGAISLVNQFNMIFPMSAVANFKEFIAFAKDMHPLDREVIISPMMRTCFNDYLRS